MFTTIFSMIYSTHLLYLAPHYSKYLEPKSLFSELNSNFIQWWIDNGYLPNPTNLRTYLYCLGNECIDLTGGWKAILNGSLTKNNSNLEYKYSKDNARNGIITTNKISIPSTASKVCIHFEYLKIADTALFGFYGTTIEASNTVEQLLIGNIIAGEYTDYIVELTIDKALTGYFCPLQFGGQVSAHNVEAKIDKIWYE